MLKLVDVCYVFFDASDVCSIFFDESDVCSFFFLMFLILNSSCFLFFCQDVSDFKVCLKSFSGFPLSKFFRFSG